MPDPVELTIVMPCLNEAETLAACIHKAQTGLTKAGIEGEVLIADNGSTDGSLEIAERLGARVMRVREKGYGCALRGGIEAAAGKWILMGDADDSYDFVEIGGFIEKLRQGYDLVMGCRLPRGGGIVAPGAMPWKNRWIGNPTLSFIGKTLYQTPINDFHCGMRAFTRNAYDRMDLKTTGMEFASEMVMKATLKSMRVAEAPITLHPDGRSRPPHLKPWRDGWRHLRFMFIYSPRWLFFLPGAVIFLIGLVVSAALALLPVRMGGVVFDVGTLVIACMSMIIGLQLVAFACFTKVFAIAEGLLPDDPKFSSMFRFFTIDKGVFAGAVVLLAGFLCFLHALWIWKVAAFGSIPYPENLRRIVTATTLIILGIQIISSSFFMSVLGLRTNARNLPAVAAESEI